MSDAAYKRVRTARNNDRPTGLDYIRHIFRGFIEFHGDRRYADDPAIVGGIARLDGSPVTVIAIEKGHTAKERTGRNFGAPNPEGYRKALRLMLQAEKFGRPVICLIDTSGAFCGIGAEERGQGQAIAENLMAMSTLCVPVISILIGEGGSGGALALAVADRVWMLQNAVYSVISPEGCASILWKDAAKAETAAASLKLTAEDAKSLGVIERILSEKEIGTKAFYDRIRTLLKEELEESYFAVDIEEAADSARQYAGDFDATISSIGLMPSYASYSLIFDPTFPLNFAGVNNQELLDQFKAAKDEASIQAVMKSSTEFLCYVPLYYPNMQIAYDSDLNIGEFNTALTCFLFSEFSWK